MTGERQGVQPTPESSWRIPARWTLELQSVARIVVGFLVFRHGMEQVLGFPAAGTEVPTASLYGALKVLCFPGGLLLMLGLLTRPTTLATTPRGWPR